MTTFSSFEVITPGGLGRPTGGNRLRLYPAPRGGVNAHLDRDSLNYVGGSTIRWHRKKNEHRVFMISQGEQDDESFPVGSNGVFSAKSLARLYDLAFDQEHILPLEKRFADGIPVLCGIVERNAGVPAVPVLSRRRRSSEITDPGVSGPAGSPS